MTKLSDKKWCSDSGYVYGGNVTDTIKWVDRPNGLFACDACSKVLKARAPMRSAWGIDAVMVPRHKEK